MEDFYNQNNLHLNPWKQLPADVTAVCSVNDQYSMYIVSTTNDEFYEYELNYQPNNNNPSITKTKKGTIQF